MPTYAADYVASLANQTGWSERFILEELPLCRGFQYQHCFAISSGASCEWVYDPDKQRQLMEFDSMIKSWASS